MDVDKELNNRLASRMQSTQARLSNEPARARSFTFRYDMWNYLELLARDKGVTVTHLLRHALDLVYGDAGRGGVMGASMAALGSARAIIWIEGQPEPLEGYVESIGFDRDRVRLPTVHIVVEGADEQEASSEGDEADAAE